MNEHRTNSERTEISSLGEFGLIDRLTEQVKLRQVSSKVGIGDDAAVLETDDQQILVSTDLLLEGVHFDLSYAPLPHLGYKAVSVNVSDIAAMNGRCRQITFSLGISNRFSVEALEQLYQGVYRACTVYGVDLVGGDTTSSQSGLVISVTALGSAPAKQVVLRSNAQENDLICVSGNLGAAFMGLQVLAREKQVFLDNQEMQPKLEGYEYLIQRQLTAEARTDIVDWLGAQNIVPGAMIDVSDGLASDLIQICNASKVGARIYQDKLPIEPLTSDTALEFKLDPLTCALNGGEDYELLFTADQSHFNTISQHQDISIIGHITDQSQGADLVTHGEQIVPLTAQGWTHF